MNHEPASSVETARAAEGTRITVALIPKAAAGLTALQKRTGLSKTDITNRAISLYEFLQAQIDAENDLVIRDGETGEAQRVHFL